MEIEKETNLESRRKILKYAVYAPPALMLMSKANAGTIAASTGGMTGNENPTVTVNTTETGDTTNVSGQSGSQEKGMGYNNVPGMTNNPWMPMFGKNLSR